MQMKIQPSLDQIEQNVVSNTFRTRHPTKTCDDGVTIGVVTKNEVFHTDMVETIHSTVSQSG
jgi:hypothetical protein